jgi:DNA-binding phage protein
MMPKRAPPSQLSPTVQALQDEAKKQGKLAHVLAKECGVSLYTIQRFLTGQGSPSIDTVERVAHALGLLIKIEKT